LEDLIYLDHAATTPVDRRVLEAMWPFFAEEFGNPSSRHPRGEAAAHALDWARRSVASLLGASPGEVVFTSGGTESDNLAILGAALARGDRGGHVITTAIEHSAVLDPCRELANRHGFRLSLLPVDRDGVVDLDRLADALDDSTTLVSVMSGNNEVGTLQPIREVTRLTRARGILFHTDAVQVAGALSIDVESLGVDLLTLSGHKVYGPKGTGALYVRRGSPVHPLIFGGGQERGLRSGTENVPGIVGLATALQLAESERPRYVERCTALRDRLIKGVLEEVPDAFLTGHPTDRLPNHASFCFRGVQGEAVLVELGARGICCSSGSACHAGSTEPSHVLVALGIPPSVAHTAVRFTLGRASTEGHVDAVVGALPEIVGGLRG
jgi:cysteine desulfurase